MANPPEPDPQKDMPIVRVSERWRLKNGSLAWISMRLAVEPIAAGTIDGCPSAIHIWTQGKCNAGAGYDLVEQIL